MPAALLQQLPGLQLLDDALAIHPGADSDIDVLVAFGGPATSARYFGMPFYFEDLFGCSIDLVTEEAPRAELRPHIEPKASVSEGLTGVHWAGMALQAPSCHSSRAR